MGSSWTFIIGDKTCYIPLVCLEKTNGRFTGTFKPRIPGGGGWSDACNVVVQPGWCCSSLKATANSVTVGVFLTVLCGIFLL